MILYLIKRDRVLLTQRAGLWHPSAIAESREAMLVSLGIDEYLFDCGNGVFRAITTDDITTDIKIEDIEWIPPDDLSRFLMANTCSDDLVRTTPIFLASLG